MTAAEFELLTAEEAETILVERYARLTAAGYSPTSALIAAARVEIDIELAEQLIRETKPGLSVARSSERSI